VKNDADIQMGHMMCCVNPHFCSVNGMDMPVTFSPARLPTGGLA
jgi:hypothetical protein